MNRLHRPFHAAAALALVAATTLHASVPPPEKVPVTSQATATGLPNPLPWAVPFVNSSVCVVVTRGDSTSSSPPTAQPIVPRWWVRGGDGAWIWQGALTVPGWPALQAVSSSMQAGALGTSEDGMRTTLVVPVTSKQLAVARFEAGVWTSLGVIDAPAGENISSYLAGDGRIVGRSQQRIWVATFGAGGTWNVVSATPADLGLVGASANSMFPISIHGHRVLLRSHRNAAAGEPANIRWQHDWIEVGATSLTRGASQPDLVPDQSGYVSIGYAGSSAAAVINRADAATATNRYDTVVFGTIDSDGVLVPTQIERVEGAAQFNPRALNGLAQGRVVAAGRTWSRDTGGQWHPGAHLSIGNWVDGNSLIAGGFTLQTTADAFDCDGDGIDDGIAIANGWATDCDANGHPDHCDIAIGMVADANGDGIPDHCTGDCDANGVADLAQIRNGARESCAGDGTLAACQIAAGELDRDGNGVPDLCDADRNGNGIPDVIEIAEGAATDCDGDWRIDDVPTAANGWPIDDSIFGWGYSNLPAPGIWVMTAIQTSQLGGSIDGFRFPITVGTSMVSRIDGRPLIAFIAVDPTNDLDPRDAQVVWWQSTVFAPDRTHVEWAGGDPASGFPRLWQYVATPHIEVDAPVVWVGFRYPPDTLYGDGLPSHTCALLVANSGTLTGAGQSTWTVLTNDAPGSDPAAALASPDLDPTYFIATAQAFSNGCPRVGDVDGNGTVDGADLGRLLGDWGPAYASPCDLNHDNSVDGADLAILIAHFGE
ncbi:MAG: hypothetical protein U0625_05310 [Phycisphaerales bacterium]